MKERRTRRCVAPAPYARSHTPLVTGNDRASAAWASGRPTSASTWSPRRGRVVLAGRPTRPATVNARASAVWPRGGRTCASTPSCARRAGGPGRPRPTRRLGTPAATRPSPPLLPRRPSDREPKNLRWPARSVVVRPSQTARTRLRCRRFCLRRSRCPACTLTTPLLSGSQACPMAAAALLGTTCGPSSPTARRCRPTVPRAALLLRRRCPCALHRPTSRG